LKSLSDQCAERSGGEFRRSPEKNSHLQLAFTVLRAFFLQPDFSDVAGIIAFDRFPFPERGAPLENTQVIQKELSMQVIDLMLKASRQQLRSCHLDFFTLFVQCADRDAGRAIHFSENVGNRKTTFLAATDSLALNDFGIDERIF